MWYRIYKCFYDSSSGIQTLTKKRSQFIFATHLHGLTNIKEIKENKFVKSFHLSIERTENGVLKYNRILTPGSGSSLYGLEVCKAMDMDHDFLELASYFRNNLLKQQEMIANMQNQTQMKQSHYNSNKIVNFCEICHKNKIEVQIETHHIHYQKMQIILII